MITVLYPADSQDLVSLSTVKQALSITSSSEDAALSAIITRASGVIAAACRRVFVSEGVRETFRSYDLSRELLLSRWPVGSVAAISENDVALTDDDWELDADVGVLHRIYERRRCFWPCGEIVVEYDGGYAPDAIPAALQQACIRLVVMYRESGGRDPLLRNVTVEGVGERGYFAGAGGMPAEVVGLIAPWKARTCR